MAQRSATVYVQTCLQLTEAELTQFIHMFAEHGASLHVQVLENGNQEVVFSDNADQTMALMFAFESGRYVCSGSCRFNDSALANVMRKAVSAFKGNATVNRIYTNYTMAYEYVNGSVVRIEEVRGSVRNLVYEYQDTLGDLEKLFTEREVEREIEMICSQVNHLLDLRNDMKQSVLVGEIDARLKILSHRLFVLEV
jgi:hypothetical protein